MSISSNLWFRVIIELGSAFAYASSCLVMEPAVDYGTDIVLIQSYWVCVLGSFHDIVIILLMLVHVLVMESNLCER